MSHYKLFQESPKNKCVPPGVNPLTPEASPRCLDTKYLTYLSSVNMINVVLVDSEGEKWRDC